MTTSTACGHPYLFKATLLHQGDDDDELNVVILFFHVNYCLHQGDDEHWPIVGYLRDDMPMMKSLHQRGIGRPMGSHPPLAMIQITHNLY
jgi:hypothetical protein